MSAVTTYKHVLQIVKCILRLLKNGWKLVCVKSQVLILSRRSLSIKISIEHQKTWVKPNVQHIQIESENGLFLAYANISSNSTCNTIKSIKRAMLFAMKFSSKPTAYKMAKLTLESVEVGCFYDKATLEGPFMQNSRVFFFTVNRAHRGQHLAFFVKFWICENCGPRFGIYSTISQKQLKVFCHASATNVVDRCIDQVASKVFLDPTLR